MDLALLVINLETEEEIILRKEGPAAVMAPNLDRTSSGRDIPSLNSFFE